MNLGPMIAAAVAVAAERLARNGQRAARVTGIVLVVAGLILAAVAGMR